MIKSRLFVKVVEAQTKLVWAFYFYLAAVFTFLLL